MKTALLLIISQILISGASADELSVGYVAEELPLVAKIEAQRQISQGALSQEELSIARTLKAFYKVEGKKIRITAVLEGMLNKKREQLFFQNKKLPTGTPFSVRVAIEKPETEIELHVVDVFGHVAREKVKIDFPSYTPTLEELQNKANLDANPWRFSIGLGGTMLNYTQTGLAEYNAYAMTPKISVTKNLSAHWSLAFNAYINAVVFAERPAGLRLQFLGGNVRGGYLFSEPTDSFRFSVNTGYYYSTTLTSNDSYGYLGMNGFQVFPTFQKEFESGLLSGYFKFSLLMNGLAVLSLTNNEIAFGASWTFDPSSPHPISITTDYAILYFLFNGTEIRSRTLSVGVAYSL